jgi:hypothetical protein
LAVLNNKNPSCVFRQSLSATLEGKLYDFVSVSSSFGAVIFNVLDHSGGVNITGVS